ncbi:membrane-targeted effector domain-containing toxin [Pseudomonas sp. A-RE-19]|uniref:membrane-targeted effector domain-containing toxin n=1 Tax=Pseudomonas sp. A-RE-19 TaxID=2832401 RepID=UPI001CBF0DE3|nr:membrane-targeted effector domain-containing toxin [Pseudomonas sp. A-RE-19]
MNPIEIHSLSNSTDKATLTTIASTVVRSCPSLQDTAHEVASDLLKKYGVVGLDPDHVYFHRFKAAQSNSASFTGWEHISEKPYESMTLSQLVIHRFRPTDQDNADLLDLYSGFYAAGPEAGDFNQTNEVRLHGNDVLNYFWSVDFSTLYNDRLSGFWNDFSRDFRTLAKSNFLGKALEAHEHGQLTDTDFQSVIAAVTATPEEPVSLAMLQAESPASGGLQVHSLAIAGHVATDILRIRTPQGRQILYVPGEAEAFHGLETDVDLHWWVINQLNTEAPRHAFMSHFPLADRQAMSDNLTDLMNRLVSAWGKYDHRLINENSVKITGDAFSWLRDSTKAAMFEEARLSLTSNGDLRKKLWIGYLSASAKAFGPLATIGWPIALPVIGASLVNMGLEIDQAVNAKTSAERKAGVIGAITSGIDTLFNVPFLIGAGRIPAVGAQIEAGEVAELEGLRENLPSAEPLPEVAQGQNVLSAERMAPFEEETIAEEETPIPVQSLLPDATKDAGIVPDHYACNELLESVTPVSEPGKYQGIYRLDSDPSTAIMMNDMAYYVRYFPDTEESGHWAIIDPARPNQFIHSLPVRLNIQGEWELMPRLGLKGSGKNLSKPKANPITDSTTPQAGPSRLPAQRRPLVPAVPERIATRYDVNPQHKQQMKPWVLKELNNRGMEPTHESLIDSFTHELHLTSFRGALLRDAQAFDADLNWTSLPPRPPVPLNVGTSAELIEQTFAKFQGLVIGESQERIASSQFLIENMPLFARQGVKTLYMPRLLNDFNQADLDVFFAGGSEAMPQDLEQYLTALDADRPGPFTEIEVVRSARRNGIRVQATDCAASFILTSPGFSEAEKQSTGNYLTSQLFGFDQSVRGASKWVAVTAPENTNTFRSIAGLSERKRGLGLRIEEVGPGQGRGISIDSGIEINSTEVTQDHLFVRATDTLYADLSLHVDTPFANRTPAQLRRLLYKRGMYCFEHSAQSDTLWHRNSAYLLTETPIERLESGNYYINRPSWPRIDRKPFASLHQLSQALHHNGMRLRGRIPD